MTLASSNISPIQVDGSMMTTWWPFSWWPFSSVLLCGNLYPVGSIWPFWSLCPWWLWPGWPLWYLVMLLRSSLELWGARLQTPICFFGPRRKKSAGMIIVQVACLPDRVAQCWNVDEKFVSGFRDSNTFESLWYKQWVTHKMFPPPQKNPQNILAKAVTKTLEVTNTHIWEISFLGQTFNGKVKNPNLSSRCLLELQIYSDTSW